MKFLNILIITFILALPLSAIEYYEQIIITKTSKTSNLKTIRYKLNTIKIKMFVQKYKSKYIIYSQKYNSHRSAQSALRRIKHYFKYAKIIKHDGNSSKNKNTNKFFVNFALGEYSATGGESNSGLSYLLESGYMYDKDIFLSLSYLNNSSGGLSTSNIYTSLNYKKSFRENIDLYTGGLIGYSKLKKSGFTESSSISFGIQFGAIYKLYDYLDIYTAYQGIKVDHIVKISATKDLKIGFIHNFQIGVSYKFSTFTY